MSEETGFTSMAGPAAEGEVPEIGVGMLGYAFMGKAHPNAYKTIPYMMYPPPAIPKLVSVSGRSASGVAAAARRYGYEKYTTDWREQVNDPDIQLFDNGGPNDAHALAPGEFDIGFDVAGRIDNDCFAGFLATYEVGCLSQLLVVKISQ